MPAIATRILRILPPTVSLLLSIAVCDVQAADAALTEAPRLPAQATETCVDAEPCFRAALGADRTVKLDRLRQVQERHPGSVWAKRAALVSGLTLLDRDPSEAMRSLRAAQRDFPLLADYVRLWLGEGHFKAGDFATAAKTFE